MKLGGYFTSAGYCGFLPDGRKMLFATISDYLDYIEETPTQEGADIQNENLAG